MFVMAIRTLVALARERMVPEWLAAIHGPSGTPRNAVVFVPCSASPGWRSGATRSARWST
ncbi:MAG: hypothetical protein WDN24_06490 [Sphingomonas sp.]